MDLVAADDYPHLGEIDSPGWIENWWLTFADASCDVQGVIYSSHQAGRAGFMRIFLTRGTEQLAVIEKRDHAKLQVLNDRVRIGDVTYTCAEPYRRWIYRIEADEVRIDLEWTGVFPPYSWNWLELTNSQHVEQTGRVVGTVTVGSRTFSIDGLSQRDRAWGARQASDFHHAWSSRGFRADGAVLHASIIEAEDRRLLFGYYGNPQDGSVAVVSSLALDVSHGETGGVASSTGLSAVTEAGQMFSYTVSPRFVYTVEPRDFSARMFFTLSEWMSPQAGPMIGQMDYWWRHSPAADGVMTAAGNSGKVESSLWATG